MKGKGFFYTTLSPMLKRAFGKRRRVSTVCLCLTLLISSMLLTLLCMSFANNLEELDILKENYDAFIHENGKISTADPFRLAVREALSVAQAEILVTHVLMLLLWLLPSVAGVAVVLSEAVGCETYTYALYVIYGADPKRLRRQIYGELFVVGLPALLVGIFGAWGVAYGLFGMTKVAFDVVFEVVLLYGLLILLCATAVTSRIFRRSCVKLLNNADTSAYIHSPRISRVPKRIRSHGGFYYASLSFLRMRKYHLTRALSLCLVAAVLFVLSGLTLPETYADTSAAREFTLTFSQGVNGETLQSNYLPAIEYCDGVVSAAATSGDEASRLGTHMLLEEHELGGGSDQIAKTVYTGDKWAFDTLKIACADGDTYTELGGNMTLPSPYDKLFEDFPELKGYHLDAMAPGTAVYVYPKDGPQMAGMVGSFVDISLPDGEEGYDPYGQHITVKVVAAVEVTHLTYQPDPDLPFRVDLGARITEDYLFISPQDYGALRGETYTQPIDLTEAYPEDMALAEGECYLLLPPEQVAAYTTLSTLTLLTPEAPVLEAFADPKFSSGEPNTLPTDTYAINQTVSRTGIYLGNEAEFLADQDALMSMSQRIAGKPTSGVASMACSEYSIKARRGVEGLTTPCVVFASDEHTTFVTWGTPVTALTLQNAVQADVVETDENATDAPTEETPASRLYFAVCESLVLQAHDGNAVTYKAGERMYLGTDVPKAFYDAMENARISIRQEPWSYQLTQGTLQGVLGMATGEKFLLWQMSPTSNLATSHYPPVFTGVNCYLPMGDVKVSSVMSPDLADVMLVTQDSGGTPRDTATRLSGKYAYNDFVLRPDFEMPALGSLAQGEAVLLLPEGDASLVILEGQMLRLGVYQPLGLAADDPLLYTMDDAYTRLQVQLSTLTYDYHGVTVEEVQVSGDVTAPTLVLSESDFCRVMARDGAVSEIDVYVDAHISLDALGELHETLQALVASSGGICEMRGAVLRSQATGTQRYLSVLRTMLLPLSAILPLLLLSSAHTLGLRRREEWQAFVAAGGDRRRHMAMCLWEGVLKCVLYAVCYLVMCPLAVLLVKVIGGKLHMPFVMSGFGGASCVPHLVILLLSVGLTSLLPLLDMPSQYKKKRNNKAWKGDECL